MQEKHISLVDKNDFQSIQLIPHKGFSEESRLGQSLKMSESETSQFSHWDGSLDTIHSSVEDLKLTLRSQDKQVIRLEAEKRELTTELKRVEKEVKKQKIILKAEIEAFQQFKRDNSRDDENYKGGVAKDVDEETRKVSQELLKTKAELAHYKQIYLEQRHTLARLTKQETTLKDANLLLKGKLVKQESCFNKFILGMAVRFEKSRQEFNGLMTNKYDKHSNASLKPIIMKTIVRNSRLAFDNAMLKLQLKAVKRPLVDSEKKKSKSTFFEERTSGTNLWDTNISIKLSPSFCNTLEQLKNIKRSSLREKEKRFGTIRRDRLKLDKEQFRLVDDSRESLISQFSSNERVKLNRKPIVETKLARTKSEPRLGL